jgi:pimeloyl-ACP methyl ester carboxylesterase/DNA-binding MarR family transcriptional regulator
MEFLSRSELLQGWFISAAQGKGPRPAVVLVHGWSGNAASMLPVASLHHKANYHLFLYDVRGLGLSSQDGPITILKLAENVTAAIDYLETRGDVDILRLGVVGHSFGGAAAILAAATDRRIKAVVSSSAPADLEVFIRRSMKKMYIPSWPFPWVFIRFIERLSKISVQSCSPKNRVGELQVPLLLLHGDSDQCTHPFDLDAIYVRGKPEYTKRCLIRDRGHSDIILDPRYEQHLLSFLHERLASPERGLDRPLLRSSKVMKTEAMLIAITLQRLGVYVHRNTSAIFREYGLTPRQVAVLNEILLKGEINQKQLCGDLLCDKSVLPQVLSPLLSLELIEVYTTPADGKLTMVKPTSKGKAVWQQCMKAFSTWNTNWIEPLTKDEIAQALQLQKRLIELSN